MSQAIKKNERVLKTLHIRNIQRFNVQGSEFIVTVGPDVTLDDLKCPEFWTHVSGSTFAGELNYVHVVWEDKSKLAKLYVRDFDHAYAYMEVLEYFEFDVSEETFDEDAYKEEYEVKWTSPATKYRIIRKSDGNIMNGQHGTIASKETAIKLAQELYKKGKR